MTAVVRRERLRVSCRLHGIAAYSPDRAGAQARTHTTPPRTRRASQLSPNVYSPGLATRARCDDSVAHSTSPCSSTSAMGSTSPRGDLLDRLLGSPDADGEEGCGLDALLQSPQRRRERRVSGALSTHTP